MKLTNSIPVELHAQRYPANNEEAAAMQRAGIYPRCRIPGAVALENGGALLYYECRSGDSDWGAIDIAMRRYNADGTLGGRTILADGKGRNTMNNPVMIADGEVVHLLYCENYKRVFYRRSEHYGDGWSEPREITGQIDRSLGGFFRNAIAVGPGHGVRLRSGRLIVPVWLAYNRSDICAHHPSVISVIYSDDRGENWQSCGVIDAKELADPSETCIAELADGRVIINIRNENDDRRRRTMVSLDGGLRWDRLKKEEQLPDPVCCAGMCADGDGLLFSNCANEERRADLTLKRLSPDGEIEDSVLISPIGGYSDVCRLPDGRALVFYERDRDLYLAEICKF